MNNPAYSPAVNDNIDRINPSYDGESINENPTYDTAIAVPAGGNTNGENPAYAGADGANTTGATVPTSSSDYAQPDDAILRQTVQNSAYYDMGSDTCSRVSFSESFSQESNSTLGENQNPEFNKMLTSLESERDEYNKQFGTAMEGFEGLVSPCSAPSHSDIQADNKVFIDDNKVKETCNLKNHLGGFKIGLDGILNQRFYSTKKDNVKEKYKQKHREIVEINNILIKDTKRLNNLKKCFGDLDEDKLKNLRFYSLIYRNKKNEWEYLTTLKEISQISQQIVSDVVNQSNRKKKSDVKKNIYCLVQVEDKEDLFFVIPFFIRHKALSGTTYNLIFEKMPNFHSEFTGLPESTNLGVSTPSSQGVADDFAREKSTRNPTYDRKDFNGLPEEFVNELFKGQEVPPSNALGRNNTAEQNTASRQGNASATPGGTSAEQNNASITPGRTSATQGGTSAEQGNASAEQGNASAQGSNSAPPSNAPRQGNTSATQGSNSASPPPTTVKPPDGCVKGFLRQIKEGDQLTGNIVDIKTEPNNWSWVIVEDLIKTSANITTYCGDCLLYIEPTKDKGHILTPLPGGWRFVKVTGNLGSVGQQISFSVNLYPGQATTAANTAQSGTTGDSLSILTETAKAQYNKEGKLKKEKIRYLAQIIFKVENVSTPRGLKINYFENKYKLESDYSCYLSDKWQKERSFFSRKVKKRIVLDKKLFWEDSQTQTPPDKKSIYSANHYQKLKNKDGLQFNENEGERIGFIVKSSRFGGVSTNGIMRACTNHVIIYQVTGDKTPKGLEENLIRGINKFDDFINKEGYNDIESWKIKIDHHFMFFNPNNTCSQDTKFGKYILPTISGGGTRKRTRQMPPTELKNRWPTKKKKNNSNIRSKKINLSNNKRSKKLNKIREN